MNENELKLEYNKKAIGKQIYVVRRNGYWNGKIVDVSGPEAFMVQLDYEDRPREISIFDVRYPDEDTGKG